MSLHSTYMPGLAPFPRRDEDADLLSRAAEGDSEAFSVLFQRHRDGLRGFLYRRLRSLDEADDALAVTFCNAWRARASFRGGASGKAWLYQIATRVSLDLLRRRKRHPEQELDAREPDLVSELEADCPDPVSLVVEQDGTARTCRAVQAAMSRLPEEERRLVRLFYFEGCDYDEISRRLGVTRNQVRGRLHRIRKRLEHDLVHRQQWQPA